MLISLRRSAANRHVAIDVQGLNGQTNGSAASGEPEKGRLHALWLRDACTCSSCRRPTTNERLLDPAGLGLSLTLVSVHPLQSRSLDESVEISFSDGHSSKFRLSDLVAAADFSSTTGHQVAELRVSTSPTATMPAVGVEALDDSLEAILDSVWFDGVVLLRGVEPTEAGLLEVAKRIGPVMHTNYGTTWSFESEVPPDGGPMSQVESRDALRMHADLPYRANPPGIQLNLGVTPASKGGASTFVDAYAMAERLRITHPRAWELLTTVPFTYPYRRPGIDLSGGGPMIGLDHAGRYGVMRRAPDLVGSPRVSADDVPDLYRALSLWQDLVDSPDNQLRVKLDTGDLVIFDNHRMLHGRTAFQLQPGERRWLMGCYVDMDEFHARRSVLAVRDSAD